MQTYQEKVQILKDELQQIERDLAALAPERPGALVARAASVRRSIAWYTKRLPRRLGTLAVGVYDDIATAERV